jgi:predicted regulator of Ras-like GTPase activity (Roadblock/LC7/MglB family)
MNWFQTLGTNRYIRGIMVLDQQGRLLRSSLAVSSDDELLPSMLQAMDVLAQSLADELELGRTQMVLASMDRAYLLVFPLFQASYYIALLIDRLAPIAALIPSLERMLSSLTEDELESVDPLPDLNADEIIQAVADWLRHKPLG